MNKPIITDIEYWKAVCERDSDWGKYCKTASQHNWSIFADSDIREKKLRDVKEQLEI